MFHGRSLRVCKLLLLQSDGSLWQPAAIKAEEYAAAGSFRSETRLQTLEIDVGHQEDKNNVVVFQQMTVSDASRMGTLDLLFIAS